MNKIDFKSVLKKYKLIITIYLLTLAISSICLRIEWLNYQAGGRLPNREYRNGNPEEGVVKWRQSLITSEKMWRICRMRKDKNRKLTADEQIEMEKTVSASVANNKLRGFVSSFGLLQYLFIPITLILGIRLLVQRQKYRGKIWLSIPPICIAIACWMIAFYRSYFTSLGW